MIIRMVNGRPEPRTLPCGCPVVGKSRVVGLDGEPIKGLVGLNTKTGWFRVQHVDPRFLRVGPDGRKVVVGGKRAFGFKDYVAPFELRCVEHGPVVEP